MPCSDMKYFMAVIKPASGITHKDFIKRHHLSRCQTKSGGHIP